MRLLLGGLAAATALTVAAPAHANGKPWVYCQPTLIGNVACLPFDRAAQIVCPRTTQC